MLIPLLHGDKAAGKIKITFVLEAVRDVSTLYAPQEQTNIAALMHASAQGGSPRTLALMEQAQAKGQAQGQAQTATAAGGGAHGPGFRPSPASLYRTTPAITSAGLLKLVQHARAQFDEDEYELAFPLEAVIYKVSYHITSYHITSHHIASHHIYFITHYHYKSPYPDM